MLITTSIGTALLSKEILTVISIGAFTLAGGGIHSKLQDGTFGPQAQLLQQIVYVTIILVLLGFSVTEAWDIWKVVETIFTF